MRGALYVENKFEIEFKPCDVFISVFRGRKGAKLHGVVKLFCTLRIEYYTSISDNGDPEVVILRVFAKDIGDSWVNITKFMKSSGMFDKFIDYIVSNNLVYIGGV